MRRGSAVAILTVAAALLGFIYCGSASANVPIYGFDATTTSSQAGGHPDVAFRMEVATLATENPYECFCNAVRDLTVDTPPGLVGVPTNIAQCTTVELVGNVCPSDSQVGIVAIRLYAPLESGGLYGLQPLYNMEPQPEQLALLATTAPLIQTPIYTNISARTESDYGLEFRNIGIPRLIPPNEITQFTWGVPGDHSHDMLRWATNSPNKGRLCYEVSPLPALYRGEFPPEECGTAPGPTAPINPPTPFLLNPTSCEGPLTATLETSGYENGREIAEAPYAETTGCDRLAFNPSLSGHPTTGEADAPSGLNVDLKVPQFLSPSAASPSEIRRTTVTLPPGLTINSNAADGKLSCSNRDAAFNTRDQAHCPEYAKIGSLTIDSSALPAPLPGYVYLGEPLPGDRYRVFLIADGFSLHIKLAGTAMPDPQTGQLVVSFPNLPQTPFQEFDLHFFGAERGLLATPTQCGTYAVKTEFEPWARALPNQESTQFFTIDSGPGGTPCPPETRPFDPTMLAGVTDNTGGHHTAFTLELQRHDGDQNLSAVNVTTPPGFSATLRGVPYCPDSALGAVAGEASSGIFEQAAPSCPAASRIGASRTLAGAGSRPVSFPGTVYLAGPYKGAPLSLAVVTPAVSGPYDLGNVVVRIAIQVDPVDARITAVSDTLPSIVGGIPLRLRGVLVVLDRKDFALNPTRCAPFSVGAEVSGDQGARRNLSTPFQVANCGGLPYSPKLSLRLSGGVNRRGHPEIHARFTAASGEANTQRVSVTLPQGELLDQSHIGTICTRVDFARDACPKGSSIGRAKVVTPLLDGPLTGNAYLRSSSHELPDIAIDLEGQVDFTLIGHVDSVRGRLRTIFDTAPDVPVTSFTLDLLGGSKGLLQNSTGLCGTAKRAMIGMKGQNGAVLNSKPKVEVSCASARKQKQRQKQGHVSNGRAS